MLVNLVARKGFSYSGVSIQVALQRSHRRTRQGPPRPQGLNTLTWGGLTSTMSATAVPATVSLEGCVGDYQRLVRHSSSFENLLLFGALRPSTSRSTTNVAL